MLPIENLIAPGTYAVELRSRTAPLDHDAGGAWLPLLAVDTWLKLNKWLPADANDDGSVNQLDLVQVVLQADRYAANEFSGWLAGNHEKDAVWSEGDFNLDEVATLPAKGGIGHLKQCLSQ